MNGLGACGGAAMGEERLCGGSRMVVAELLMASGWCRKGICISGMLVVKLLAAELKCERLRSVCTLVIASAEGV